MRSVAAAKFGAVVALLLALGSTPSQATGEPATLALHDLEGRPRSLAEHAGNIVVVNFWATWCRPCREELPLLEQVSAEFRDRGVVFVAASTDAPSTVGRIPDAIDESGVTFAVWTGATTVDMQRLGLGTGVPATAIVDRDGNVAFRIVGLVNEEELRERLDWLLGDSDAAAPEAALDHLADDDCCDHDDDGPETADAVATEEHCDHDHGGAQDHDHEHDSEPHAGDASLVPS